MKKLFLLSLLTLTIISTSAQRNLTREQRDSIQKAEYKEKIGLDYSMPDYSVTSIDETKMGTRLANLLRFYEEVNEQSVYSRMVNKILGEQNEEFEHVYIELKKQKLVKVEKVANEITIIYRLWLNKNPKNIKQADVSFHFKDGISESQIVNEMFSNMSRYVQTREKLNKIVE